MASDSEEKKMVQRVKEILHDRSEVEICAALKECGMNPDEAVQRLLTQDTFREVKSKRERRKEMKEMQDTKPRVGSGVSDGGWGYDHEDGRTTVQSNSNAHGTTTYKRENRSVSSSVSYSSSAIQAAGKISTQQSMHDNESFHAESREQSTVTGSTATSSLQPPTKSEQCGSVAGVGRASVSDIVRRGPLHNGSAESTETSLNLQDVVHPLDGLGTARNGGGTREQTTSCSENTRKKGSQEGSSDAHRVSYSEEPLPEQASEDAGSVVLPSHLQALAADCSHLSFGTFNSKSSSGPAAPRLPNSLKIDSERFARAGDGLPSQQLYNNRQLLTEMPEPLRTQLTREQMLGAAFGNGQTAVASDLVSRGSRNSNQELLWEPTHASSYRKEEPPQYSSEKMGVLKGMQGYLQTTGQSFRPDSFHSMSRETPPMPLGYGAAVSLAETFTPDPFRSFEPSSQASHASHRIPDRIFGQAYPQPVDLLKQYTNLNGHQNITPEYAYIIPYQQAPGSTKQVLPQYKRDDLMRMETPNYDTSRFEGFQGYNNLLGDFLYNSAVAPNPSAVGYNNMLQNQSLKDPNQFLRHGLGNDGSAAWDYKAGQGATQAARESAYYDFLLAQERNLGHQPDRQYPQDYSTPGDFSSYHPQVGNRQDDQLFQNFRDMNLNNNRTDPPSKQDPFWQQRRY